MSIGAAVSAIVSVINDRTARPMTGMMAACAFTGFIILMIGSKIVRYKASLVIIDKEKAEMIKTF